MQLEQISNSIWAIVDGSTYGNVGCIRIPNQIIVIDTGMTPVLAKKFHTLIQSKIGTPITDVILTHYHSDHVFGSQEFTQYRFIASAELIKQYQILLKNQWSKEGIEEIKKFYAETEPRFSRQLNNLEIVIPTTSFEKSLFLGENNQIEIYHTGGHTVGHSIIYFKPEQVLFAGDLVFCQEYPYAGDDTNNPLDWMKAFEAILEKPIDIIIPGHGPLCDKKEIRTQLAYFRRLEKWIRDKIDEGVSVGSVLKEQESGPTPPYSVKAERRLPATLERWFNFYSLETK